MSIRVDGGGDWEVTIQQDIVDATPIDEQDPDWRHTDPAGHEHRYSRLPGLERLEVVTVEWVDVGEPYWCEDCCDIHQDAEDRCVECGAVVVPGTRAVVDRRYMAGLTHVHGFVRRGVDGFDRLLEYAIKQEILDELPLLDLDGRRVLLSGVRATDVTENEVRFIAAGVRQ